ncbi:chitin synthase, putative [Entamoeba invadens IP1]|uniref:chitin synthase n=2 Tax=Entamoeba invadens TaxID=33085 RepID=L7FK10_ENTIV|nr:chitin synthase, putative [Entamoeba invadens IP1]ELP84895.1 chitin synthase, putative [Entamoeba invadens IP1]|eukprot:XP_004184241.1 chitin synthase, putative [Entamoeba invadens IP1]
MLTFGPSILAFRALYRAVFYEKIFTKSILIHLLCGIVEGGSQGIAMIIFVYFFENTQQYITLLYLDVVSFLPFLFYIIPAFSKCRMSSFLNLIFAVIPLASVVVISWHYEFYWQMVVACTLNIVPYWRSLVLWKQNRNKKFDKHRNLVSFVRELTKLVAIIVGFNLVYFTDTINQNEYWLVDSDYLVSVVIVCIAPFILHHTTTWGMKALMPITTTTLPLLFSTVLSLLIYLLTCHWNVISEIENGMCTFYAGDADWWFVACFVGVFFSVVFLCFHIINQSQYVTKTRDVWTIPDVSVISPESSLLLNRQMDDTSNSTTSVKDEATFQQMNIIVCATMYHENQKEMERLLESFTKLDSKEESKGHVYFCIVFDDACRTEGTTLHCNLFVDQLVRLLQQERIKLEYETQWFGAVAFGTFKNTTPITVFLKDSSKIKRNKRYSQLVLFNYAQRILPMKNTFVLFTDGDTYFSPSSVEKLCLEISAEPRCGAISGRVFPDGKGIWAQYQQFEYATSHWLQKTAEEELGTVLCCPGCFTLVRLESVFDVSMKDINVFEKYCEQPKSGMGVLTHNFGEDRWMSYLLVERGWWLKYCSITKSKSFCPTTTMEFFNQRRRWLTSTWANTAMIVKNWMTIKTNNKRVNTLFMIYTFINFIATFATPATTLLLVYGFLVNNDIPYCEVIAFVLAVCPTLFFLIVEIITMFKPSPRFEIITVDILKWFYAFEMLLVVANIVYSCVTVSTISISLLFCGLLIVIYAVTILLHAEFEKILGGVITFFLIPTTNILLIIYSLVHLNDVTWGTREQKGEAIEKLILAKESNYNYLERSDRFTVSEVTNVKKMQSQLRKTQFGTAVIFLIASTFWIGLSVGLMVLDSLFKFTIFGMSFSFMLVPTCLTLALTLTQFFSMLFHRMNTLAFILSRTE